MTIWFYLLPRQMSVRGYKRDVSSFNVKGGCCSSSGDGTKIEILPDVYVACSFATDSTVKPCGPIQGKISRKFRWSTSREFLQIYSQDQTSDHHDVDWHDEIITTLSGGRSPAHSWLVNSTNDRQKNLLHSGELTTDLQRISPLLKVLVVGWRWHITPRHWANRCY